MVEAGFDAGTQGLYIQERMCRPDNHEAGYRKVLASPLTLVVTRGALGP